MNATDTTALQERIAEELFYSESPEERHRDGWLSAYSEDRYLYRDLAAAVLPIIAAEVQAAKAAAWDEGYIAPIEAAAHNPYRETGGSDEHR